MQRLTAAAPGSRHNGPMSIRQWPLNERPREKLLSRGAAALSDAELLAIFLGSGGRGEDAVARGRRLLGEHGSLRGLLSLPPERLQRLPGIGPAIASRLLAALELGSRHLGEDLARGSAITDPNSAGALFRARLRDRPHEVFACVFLDTRHRMIAFEELFNGGIDGAEVHPREVVRRCISHNAAAVLFGHNHPSGVAEPSAADRAITQRLREALALIDVRVLDHFVVGDGAPVSLAARGWM
jgi:DNA repair protein RadC